MFLRLFLEMWKAKVWEPEFPASGIAPVDCTQKYILARFVTSHVTVIVGSCSTEVIKAANFYFSFLLDIDDTDDPMEMKLKRDHSEENVTKAKTARMTEQT